MKDFDIGIRVDMGGKIGSGHFFRCLSIANELKKNGKSVIFLTNNKSEIKRHLKIKIPFIVLKGKTELKKIQECKIIMNNLKVLIIDLPFYEERYGKKLENVVLINDLGNMRIFSKILFNGSIVKKFHKYTIQNKSSKLYINSKYIILRKQFLEERNNVKIHQKPIKNILITFGGSGDNNITKKLLSILHRYDFNITVIIGPGNKKKNFPKLKNNKRIRLIINPNNIAKLFSKQDIIIASTGITIYELACLGIPTLMIPINSAQNETAKEMERRGFGKLVNSQNLNFEKIQRILSKFEDYRFRHEMYISGRKIVDGKGTERVVNVIKKNLLDFDKNFKPNR